MAAAHTWKVKSRINIQSVRTKQVTLGSYTGCLDRITCDIEWGGTFSLGWVGFITILNVSRFAQQLHIKDLISEFILIFLQTFTWFCRWCFSRNNFPQWFQQKFFPVVSILIYWAFNSLRQFYIDQLNVHFIIFTFLLSNKMKVCESFRLIII